MRPNNSCKGDNSKHGTEAFHFYLEVWYLDNNIHNIHVSSDKLGFFLLYFGSFESCAIFGYKNKNIKYTNCPISTHPAKKITLACYTCLCFIK